MLDFILEKLEGISQDILFKHEYIDRYEALCLVKIPNLDPNSANTLPISYASAVAYSSSILAPSYPTSPLSPSAQSNISSFKNFHRLVTDLSSILDEAYAIHANLVEENFYKIPTYKVTKSSELSGSSSSSSFNSYDEEYHYNTTPSVDVSTTSIEFIDNVACKKEVDYNLVTRRISSSVRDTSTEWPMTPSLTQLSFREDLVNTNYHAIIKEKYSSTQKMLKQKLAIRTKIISIIDYYSSNVVQIANDSNVINSFHRAQFLFVSTLDNLLNHKLFNIEVENRLLEQIYSVWSKLYLAADASDSDSLLSPEVPSLNALSSVELNSMLNSQSSRSTFINNFLIFKLGIILVLILWFSSECFYNEVNHTTIWQDPTFPMFLSIGSLLLLYLFWGVSVNVWERFNINYVKLLGMDSSHMITEAKRLNYSRVSLYIYDSATNNITIYLLFFIVFNKLLRNSYNIPLSSTSQSPHVYYAHAVSLIFFTYFLYKIFFPLKDRKFEFASLYNVLATPFTSVNFRDGYIGDILTSLVRIFISIFYSFVYVFSFLYSAVFKGSFNYLYENSPSNSWWMFYNGSNGFYHILARYIINFLTLWPLFIRLFQCLRRSVDTNSRWPHYGNSLKYTLAILVVSINLFHGASLHENFFWRNVWILFFFVTTLYQILWDIFQDWGILEIYFPTHATDNNERNLVASFRSPLYLLKLLNHYIYKVAKIKLRFRSQLLITNNLSYYLLVIAFNILLRFTWTLTLLPPDEYDDDTHGWHKMSIYNFMVNHAGPIIAGLEIIRRMVWGFYRLEWEQIEKLKECETDKISTSIPSDSLYSDFKKFDKVIFLLLLSSHLYTS